jgi:glycyl-tRNA synthetase beta chain
VSDFLLELRCEEIPARMQGGARGDLARLFAGEIERAGIETQGIQVWSTPRRLALIARGLPEATEGVTEELKGPRVGAADQAIDGFLKKNGLSRGQLEERSGVYFAHVERAGRPTVEILAEAIERIVCGFPWPKSMRWGEASGSTASLRWVRPLHGIVAMLGEAIVPASIDGIEAGATTVGHRFHHPGPITIGGADDYFEKLRACHVIVDQEERERLIREGAAKAAAEAGLRLVEDEGLVVENAGLTEWPVPLLGRFDADFLDVPREVIVLTMRTNQKYFACTGADGALAPAFVCVANIAASDGGAAIVEGNKRVLAARLSDARFFWEQDLKVPLAEQAAKLGGIVFHEKLGTIADKVERVARLARWLVEEGIVKPSPLEGEDQGGGRDASASQKIHSAADAAGPHSSSAAARPPDEPNARSSPQGGGVKSLADFAERAARLAKADLVTGMVGEFPELQGVIGGYLARAQGEPDAVADAIRDHYKPIGQGDEVPTAPVTVAVSLADKLDTILEFFRIGEKPTGSKDPFALRRSAIGANTVAQVATSRFDLREIGAAFAYSVDDSGVVNFMVDRLKVQQKDEGVRHDLIEAVASLGASELKSLLARVKALQSFVETGEGGDLLAGYKRAANLLKKEEGSWTPDLVRGDDVAVEEQALISALDAAEPKASAAIEAEDFTAAMAALASLRGPIDAFFDKVTVNDPDAGKRARRLGLLARFREAVHRVADFSKIEG